VTEARGVNQSFDLSVLFLPTSHRAEHIMWPYGQWTHCPLLAGGPVMTLGRVQIGGCLPRRDRGPSCCLPRPASSSLAPPAVFDVCSHQTQLLCSDVCLLMISVSVRNPICLLGIEMGHNHGVNPKTVPLHQREVWRQSGLCLKTQVGFLSWHRRPAGQEVTVTKTVP
jgi:hypothetical protein